MQKQHKCVKKSSNKIKKIKSSSKVASIIKNEVQKITYVYRCCDAIQGSFILNLGKDQLGKIRFMTQKCTR